MKRGDRVRATIEGRIIDTSTWVGQSDEEARSRISDAEQRSSFSLYHPS